MLPSYLFSKLIKSLLSGEQLILPCHFLLVNKFTVEAVGLTTVAGGTVGEGSASEKVVELCQQDCLLLVKQKLKRKIKNPAKYRGFTEPLIHGSAKDLLTVQSF